MKKLLVSLFVFNIFILGCNALEDNIPIEEEKKKTEVKLIRCENAISSWIEIGGKSIRIRLIAIDTSDGDLNQEIDDYVCNLLDNSKKLEIEEDPEYNELDEYNRLNVWVYVDDKLLQSDLIDKGYAQVNYIKGQYLYLNDLCEIQKKAIIERKGIWVYPKQEEKYCKSEIDLDVRESKKEEVVMEEKEDYSYLYYMISINILVIILALVIRFK